MKNTRVAGHALQAEGAPYMHLRSGGTFRVHGIGTAGTGFALCSCGERSPVLASAKQRQQWHREHKAEVQAAS